jgi:DNA repair exonuclease SbcCD ATPase subunit
MLQGSRGIQDLSVAGIPGVVNNLEGLATALGLGAGAAGGVTLIAVAVDLLVRNWAKLSTAFGGEGGEKVAEFWSAMTPDESVAERYNAVAKAQERIADAIERTATARKRDLDAQQAEDEAMEKRKKIWKELTPEKDKNELPPPPGTGEASPELVKAARNQAKVEADVTAAVEQAHSADAAFEKQKQRVDAINKLGSFDARVKVANAQDEERLKEASSQIKVDATGKVTGTERYDEIKKRMEDRTNQMRSELPNVQGLTDGLTGDPKKDRETLQKRAADERAELRRLETERYQKAKAADEAENQLPAAKQAVTDQAKFDRETEVARAMKAAGMTLMPGEFASADKAMGFNTSLPGTAAAAESGVGPAVQQAGQQTAEQMQQASQALVQGLQPVQQAIDSMQQNLVSALSALAGKFVSVNGALTEHETRIRQQEIAGRQ